MDYCLCSLCRPIRAQLWYMLLPPPILLPPHIHRGHGGCIFNFPGMVLFIKQTPLTSSGLLNLLLPLPFSSVLTYQVYRVHSYGLVWDNCLIYSGWNRLLHHIMSPLIHLNKLHQQTPVTINCTPYGIYPFTLPHQHLPTTTVTNQLSTLEGSPYH